MTTPLIKRIYTRADVENFFNSYWGKFSIVIGAKNALTSIELLPELNPPSWLVSYASTWDIGTHHEHTNYNEMVVTQKTRDDGQPYLNLLNHVGVPEGLASVAEEDAEMERLAAEKEAEYQKRWEEKRRETSD